MPAMMAPSGSGRSNRPVNGSRRTLARPGPAQARPRPLAAAVVAASWQGSPPRHVITVSNDVPYASRHAPRRPGSALGIPYRWGMTARSGRKIPESFMDRRIRATRARSPAVIMMLDNPIASEGTSSRLKRWDLDAKPSRGHCATIASPCPLVDSWAGIGFSFCRKRCLNHWNPFHAGC